MGRALVRDEASFVIDLTASRARDNCQESQRREHMTETTDAGAAPAAIPGAKNQFARLHATIVRPRAVTDGDTVLATVDIAAPPERILRALTSDDVETWWGSPDTYRMTDWTSDLRVGGRWRVNVRTAEGAIFPASGRFLEIAAPHSIVQTRVYDWDHPLLGRRETTVTYFCDPIATGTRLTVRHDGFGLRAPAEEHAVGWERVLAWLAAYLQPAAAEATRSDGIDIVHSVDVAATADHVYEALTTETGLAGWWTADNKVDRKIGSINQFRFGPDTLLTFRVDELEPSRRVAWSSIDGPPDWKGTQVTFDITPKGNTANLHFRHEGFAAGYELFGMFNYLWAQNLRSLKLWLETGTGEPFGSAASKAAKAGQPIAR
jgi:uncharacterized protein YndB with AHSA1/START domain